MNVTLTIPTVFPKGHPREGQPTGFVRKILSGEKKHHTVYNKDISYYRKEIGKLKRDGGVLRVCVGQGRTQRVLKEIPAEHVSVQHLRTFSYVDTITNPHELHNLVVGVYSFDNDKHVFSTPEREDFFRVLGMNEGLTADDYKEVLLTRIKRVAPPHDIAYVSCSFSIIHLTDFKYEKV